MNVNDLKSSKFLTKHDVEPEVLATIKSCQEMDVSMESQAPEMKWTLMFHELPKPLVLNITNGKLIEAITGSDESEGWIGKKVVLYNDKTIMFAGQLTGGIRIKAPRQQTEPDAPDDITNPDYVGDNPPPPPDDGIPY